MGVEVSGRSYLTSRRHTMRRERIFGVIAFLAFCALFSFPALAVDRIRISLSSSSVSPNHGAFYNAEMRGIFKKYGIEAEVIEVGGGAARG
jgi:ABC-type nitrate/sulfonate/bicarbonate transport system substrate-binding protein